MASSSSSSSVLPAVIDIMSHSGSQKEVVHASSSSSVGRLRILDISLRCFIMALSAVSIGFMLTSSQHTSFSIIGIPIPISMNWSTAQPFFFLVVAQAVICSYAFLQFIHQSVMIAKKSPLRRRSMWIQLAADQASVYLVLAAAAAAMGASEISKSGFVGLDLGESFQLPPACSLLHKFCNGATVAIISTLLGTFASSLCAALDVYMLTLTC